MRMAGRTGNDRVKMINLQVMKIIPEQNVIVVKGSVPGPNNSLVKIERWS
jgi:large subunit ribosomal protein L3